MYIRKLKIYRTKKIKRNHLVFTQSLTLSYDTLLLIFLSDRLIPIYYYLTIRQRRCCTLLHYIFYKYQPQAKLEYLLRPYHRPLYVLGRV